VDVFQRLARRLDQFPQGFPPTPTGVELRILRKIFSPADAELALELKMIPETAGAIARRLRRPAAEVRAALDRMAARGQIYSFRQGGVQRFMLAPFVVGIWEFQLPHMDAELASLFEEYAPTLLATLGQREPALARVVPVNRAIPARPQVLRYESVADLIARARSFRVMECICRKEQAALGRPCSHPSETCLSFSPEENAYEEGPVWGRSITREEALAILARAEQEGLVHCTYNLQRQNMFVCNCCPCCCGFLRALREYSAPHVLLRSNYVAVVDGERCAFCSYCIESRCPVDAMVERDGAVHVLPERCIGCGVCTVDCPASAVTLVARPPQERTTPPKDLISWHFQRAVGRFGPLRAALQFGGLALDALRSREPAGEPLKNR